MDTTHDNNTSESSTDTTWERVDFFNCGWGDPPFLVILHIFLMYKRVPDIPFLLNARREQRRPAVLKCRNLAPNSLKVANTRMNLFIQPRLTESLLLLNVMALKRARSLKVLTHLKTCGHCNTSWQEKYDWTYTMHQTYKITMTPAAGFPNQSKPQARNENFI